MKLLILIPLICTISRTFSAEVRLVDLDPNDAQQIIEQQDQTLSYAPKVDSNVPAVRYLGNEPHQVLEDIYLARQYHGQDGLGGYLYGYAVPDIAKTEKKKAGGDLRGAYNYIAGDGQEIKVEYWDDGTGFHQIDNVPKILPKPIEDSPEVKAEKEKFLARWHEEAERNQHPVQNPYNSEGQYANGPLSVQGQLQRQQQFAHQPQPYGPRPQYPQFSQTASSQSVNQYQPQPSQHANTYQQPGAQQTYQHQSGGQQYQPGLQSGGYQQQPSQLHQQTGYSQPQGVSYQPQASSQHAVQYQPQASHAQGGQYQQQANSHQGVQYQPQATSSQGQYHQQPSPQQSGQHQTQPSSQFGDQYQPAASSQQGVQYQPQATSKQGVQYQPHEGQGQYSGGQQQEEEEETTGPPKGFFYSFDYPVGIIVQKDVGGGVVKREGDLKNVYTANKSQFEAQVKSGSGQSGAYLIN